MKRSLPAFIAVVMIGLAIGAALAGLPSTPERDVVLVPASSTLASTAPDAP